MNRSIYDNLDGTHSHGDGDFQTQSGFGEMIGVFKRRKEVIFFAFLILAGLTAVFAYTKQPTYKASSVVMVETKIDDDAEPLSVKAKLSAVEEIKISTTVEIIKSRNYAEKLALALMAGGADFNQSNSSLLHSASETAISWITSLFERETTEVLVTDDETRRLRAATDQILRDVSVSQVGKSRLIKISALGATPKEAAGKANSLVEVYLDSTRRDRKRSRNRRIEQIKTQLGEAQLNLFDADLSVAKYMKENDLITTNGQSAVQNRISRLETAMANSRTESLSRQLNQKLKEKEDLSKRLADLSVIYGDGYPEITDIKAQLTALQLEIESERDRVRSESRNRRALVDESAAALTNEIQSVRRQHFAALEANAGLKELERNATLQLELFRTLSDRLQRLKNSSLEDKDDIKVVSKAVAPNVHSGSSTNVILAAGSLGAIIISVLLGFTAEAFDTKIRSSDHVRKLMGSHTLAMIPKAPSRMLSKDKIRNYVLENPDSDFSESMRNLYLEIVSDGVHKNPRIIVVTSVLPGEGVSTISEGLAAIAETFDCRAICYSLDRRERRRLAAEHGVRSDFGFIPTDSALTESRVIDDDEPNQETTALSPISPDEAGSSVSLRKLSDQLSELSERWNMVIVDAPSILKSLDAKALAPYASNVIVAMEWSKTPPGAVRAAKDLLHGVVNVSAVLNRVNLKSHAKRAYGDATQYAYK